jgi:hypothetical protein
MLSLRVASLLNRVGLIAGESGSRFRQATVCLTLFVSAR